MRTGLRIKGAHGNPIVKDALVKYAKWLRKRYEFPVRVPVYLFPGDYIITSDYDEVAASYFAPYLRKV